MSDHPEPDQNLNRTGGPSTTAHRLVERHYLSLNDPAQFQSRASPSRASPSRASPSRVATLRALSPSALSEWRALYKRVGAPWQWHDRDAWPDERLASYLAQPEVSAYAVDSLPAVDAGMLELCAHSDGSVEIVYLGLTAELFGHGLGAWLLSEAVQLAWKRGASRVWLHTCSLDSPHALPNYLARGFTIDRTETYSVNAPSEGDVRHTSVGRS